jgi:hypothetical protein
MVVERVQGAWAGVDSAGGEALEALAAGAPTRDFDGVAGPVAAAAGVVEHGEGPGIRGLAWAAAAVAACGESSAAASSESESEAAGSAEAAAAPAVGNIPTGRT